MNTPLPTPWDISNIPYFPVDYTLLWVTLLISVVLVSLLWLFRRALFPVHWKKRAAIAINDFEDLLKTLPPCNHSHARAAVRIVRRYFVSTGLNEAEGMSAQSLSSAIEAARAESNELQQALLEIDQHCFGPEFCSELTHQKLNQLFAAFKHYIECRGDDGRT